MCGIIGILGQGPVAEQLVNSLKRLEYRGYDSAGVATIEGGRLERRRAEGKLKNLEARLQREPLQGHSGIGHTRWATHGKPTETNAHPHATERVAVVHNGIIENFRELREELEKAGATFKTETDTETVVQLVDDYLGKGMKPVDAVKAALPKLRGAFALGFVFAGEDDLMIGARKGAPLAIGYGDKEMYLGSDAIALSSVHRQHQLPRGRRLGGAVACRRHRRDERGTIVKRQVQKSGASSFLVDKANYRHFMAKEIHEQPEVVGHTLAHYLDMSAEKVALPVGCRSISPSSSASRSRPVARRVSPGRSPNTGSSGWRGCRSTSTSPPSSATARRRCARTIWRCSCRNRAKRPTRWPPCATPREQGQHVLSIVNVPTLAIARESPRTSLPTLSGT